MKILIISSLLIGNIFGENCDQYGIALYQDMACEPQKNNENNCPTSYKCKGIEVSDQCIFQGNSYNKGDDIQLNTIGTTCEFGCYCLGPQVNCAQGMCGEYAHSSSSSDCYYTYNLEKCCASGEKCTSSPDYDSTIKCMVDGKEYREGERFYPKDSCHVCVCQKDFTGKYEAPFCKRMGCDAQLRDQLDIQKSCAPVYIRENNILCCPSTWTCPNGNEIITSVKHSVDKCKFGKKNLNIGDQFTKLIQFRTKLTNIKCVCQIPPLVTCTVVN